MTWLFNTDYETKLFSQNPLIKESHKINQEFEYLMGYLNYFPIATNKLYSDNFKLLFKKISGTNFETSNDIKNAKNFWGSLNDIEKERFYNSKITSTEFVLKNNLNKSFIHITNEIDNKFKNNNYIIKNHNGFSGRQTFKGDQFKESEPPYIVEEYLNRIEDFSVLNIEQKFIIYENFIDEYFQYKGSIFNRNNLNSISTFLNLKQIDNFQIKNYENMLEKIKEIWPLSQPFSIDSFIYKKENLKNIYFMCEINYRKTFGWLAYQLGNRFYLDKNYFGLFILNKKKINKSIDLKNCLSLSPAENNFQVFIWGTNELNEKEEIIDYFLAFYKV